MSIAVALHMIGVFMIQFVIEKQMKPDYGLGNLAFASLILMITNIWQVPLCFFLAKKIAFVASVTINTILGIFLGILFADNNIYLLCPYSWGIRLMVPIMKILPNGLPAEDGNTLLNTQIILPTMLSIILFALLSIFTSRWFSEQEIK